jgi:hypothetical protein
MVIMVVIVVIVMVMVVIDGIVGRIRWIGRIVGGIAGVTG